ncbi:MAG: DUF3291 domain-containing protein [Rhodobacteraceae bacterium]|nr:DUF3291 domain-containing protein [Paracoccaceae bacterium]MCP5341705.1 DUF3291 domain-containing protein [Paracoccaceae bacterium]
MQETGHHLAQFDAGRLIVPNDDPRVVEFMDASDRVTGAVPRMPGFARMIEGSAAPETGNTGTCIGSNPRFLAHLAVRDSAEAQENLVWKTARRRLCERRADRCEAPKKQHFAVWRVAAGHGPALTEVFERLAFKQERGASDRAFGWLSLKEAQACKTRGPAQVAAAQAARC